MTERKICPILCLGPESVSYHECLGESCAWYNPVTKECAIYALARLLNMIYLEIEKEVEGV